MRNIIAHILASLTATFSFWIPWAIFVANDHHWTVFGSNFLGSLFFGLLYNWPLILVGSILLAIPAKIVADKTKLKIIPEAGIWIIITTLIFVLMYLEQTELLLWRVGLTILSSSLAIFVYMKTIKRKIEPEDAANLNQSSGQDSNRLV